MRNINDYIFTTVNSKDMDVSDIRYMVHTHAVEIVTYVPEITKQKITDLGLKGMLLVSKAKTKEDRWSTAYVLFNLKYTHTDTAFLKSILKLKYIESIRVCTPRGTFVFTEKNIQDLVDAIAKYTN